MQKLHVRWIALHYMVIAMVIVMAGCRLTPVNKDVFAVPVKGKKWTVPNLNMKFEYVRSGTFRMGCKSEDAYGREQPVHTVQISKGFWMAKYEVTQEEYWKLMNETPSRFPGMRTPVENVSWHEAVKFCQRLTRKERWAGRLPAGYEYRLPTEAEWEYAAKGGRRSKGYKYSGSDDIDQVGWYEFNSSNRTHRGGQKQPNELELYDMSGNVQEWCLDWFVRDYYKKSDTVDPLCTHKGFGNYGHVLRGGAFSSSSPIFCRVTNREKESLESGNLPSVNGFRLVLAPAKIDHVSRNVFNIKDCDVFLSSENKPIKGKKWSVPKLDMELIYVKPGKYKMGFNENDASTHVQPVHEVRISEAFWMGKYEVTNAQYKSFLRDTGYKGNKDVKGDNHLNHFRTFTKDMPDTGSQYPVAFVSWKNAVKFCQWLTRRERLAGRLPEGYEYQLPSETQWEYAARGGYKSKGYKYSGSNNIDDVAWYLDNYDGKFHKVGQKEANEIGIYDMSGNVSEFCRDSWHYTYHGAPQDGTSWDDDGRWESCVLRGGGALSIDFACRITTREYWTVESAGKMTGFRVVLSPSEEK